MIRALVSGHDFSRAIHHCTWRGFSRWLGAMIILSVTTGVKAQQPGPPPAFNEPSGSFFALSVKDLNSTAAWYKQKLGFKELKQGASPDGKSRAIILDRDGIIVELISHKQAVNGATLMKGYKTYLIHGIFKVGFIVDDVDHTLQRLKANGVPIANGPYTDEAMHMRSFMIRDNEGNYIQFFSKVSG